MPNRRRTTWQDTFLQNNTVSGAQSLIALDGVLSVADSQGLTLTRLIGDISCSSNTVAGAFGVERFSFGVGMASREAFAAGIVPDPNSNVEEPPRGWVYKNTVAVSQNGIGTNVVTARVIFDIRAQRKLDSGRLFLAVNVDNVTGTSFTGNVTGLIRALFLLP